MGNETSTVENKVRGFFEDPRKVTEDQAERLANNTKKACDKAKNKVRGCFEDPAKVAGKDVPKIVKTVKGAFEGAMVGTAVSGGCPMMTVGGALAGGIEADRQQNQGQ